MPFGCGAAKLKIQKQILFGAAAASECKDARRAAILRSRRLRGGDRDGGQAVSRAGISNGKYSAAIRPLNFRLHPERAVVCRRDSITWAIDRFVPGSFPHNARAIQVKARYFDSRRP